MTFDNVLFLVILISSLAKTQMDQLDPPSSHSAGILLMILQEYFVLLCLVWLCYVWSWIYARYHNNDRSATS